MTAAPFSCYNCGSTHASLIRRDFSAFREAHDASRDPPGCRPVRPDDLPGRARRRRRRPGDLVLPGARARGRRLSPPRRSRTPGRVGLFPGQGPHRGRTRRRPESGRGRALRSRRPPSRQGEAHRGRAAGRRHRPAPASALPGRRGRHRRGAAPREPLAQRRQLRCDSRTDRGHRRPAPGGEGGPGEHVPPRRGPGAAGGRRRARGAQRRASRRQGRRLGRRLRRHPLRTGTDQRAAPARRGRHRRRRADRHARHGLPHRPRLSGADHGGRVVGLRQRRRRGGQRAERSQQFQRPRHQDHVHDHGLRARRSRGSGLQRPGGAGQDRGRVPGGAHRGGQLGRRHRVARDLRHRRGHQLPGLHRLVHLRRPGRQHGGLHQRRRHGRGPGHRGLQLRGQRAGHELEPHHHARRRGQRDHRGRGHLLRRLVLLLVARPQLRRAHQARRLRPGFRQPRGQLHGRPGLHLGLGHLLLLPPDRRRGRPGPVARALADAHAGARSHARDRLAGRDPRQRLRLGNPRRPRRGPLLRRGHRARAPGRHRGHGRPLHGGLHDHRPRGPRSRDAEALVERRWRRLERDGADTGRRRRLRGGHSRPARRQRRGLLPVRRRRVGHRHDPAP